MSKKIIFLLILTIGLFVGFSNSRAEVVINTETVERQDKIHSILEEIRTDFIKGDSQGIKDFLASTVDSKLKEDIFFGTPFESKNYSLTFSEVVISELSDTEVKVDLVADVSSPKTETQNRKVFFIFVKENNIWKLSDTDFFVSENETVVASSKTQTEDCVSSSSSKDCIGSGIYRCELNGKSIPCDQMPNWFKYFQGILVTSLILFLGLVLLCFISLWKIFAKADKPGWAVFVPFYNIIVMLEMVAKPLWWIFLMFIPIVNIVFGFIIWHEIVKSFGKGAGFLLGVIFLPFIFLPILAFGKSVYKKPETNISMSLSETSPQQ